MTSIDETEIDPAFADDRRTVGTEEPLPVGAFGQLDGHGDQHPTTTDHDPGLLHRHEAGERREQRVVFAESDDLRLDRRRRGTLFHRFEMRREDFVHLGSRPQRRDRGMLGRGGGESDRNPSLVPTRAGVAGDHHGSFDRTARRGVVPRVNEDRLRVEEIREEAGRILRKDVEGLDAFDRDLDVGEHRGRDPRRETFDDLVRAVGEKHVVRGATTFAGERIEQVSIDTVADAEREDPGGPSVVAHRLDDAAVVPHVAIGQEHHDPHRGRHGSFHEAGLSDLEAAFPVQGQPATEQFDVGVLVLHGRKRDRHRQRETKTLPDHEPGPSAVHHDGGIGHRHRDHPPVRREIRETCRIRHRVRIALDERLIDRLHHLGAATTRETVHEVPRELAILFGRRSGFGPEDPGLPRERDQIEGVVRPHALDRLRDHGLRLLERETPHRARGVEHEDELPRSNVLVDDASRGCEHHREISARDAGDVRSRKGSIRVGRHMGEDALRDRVVLKSPSQDEVAIRDRVTAGEGDVDATDALRPLEDLVQRRLDRGDRHAAGVEADVDRDVVTGPSVRTHRHRGDPTRIRNLVGVLGEAVARRRRLGKPPHEPPPADLAEAVLIEGE